MIGTTVSHYKILDKLGGGGMGVVYRAEDLTLGRQVALKFLPDALAENPEAMARFQREARAASALNHPHICVIHELGEEEGRYFIVMELMDGQTLKYWISGEPTPAEQIVKIGAQVADALEAAHEAGIVHRDLKPANLLVTARGDVKVLDFGLAKVTEDLARKESKSAEAETELAPEQLTTPGTAMGTIAYMSPEQVRGQELDERTDLFSLGVVLYEMATGRQPFEGKTAGAIFDLILNQAPTAPVRINPDLPDELEHILNKALEKDKKLRYQHASDLKADLLRLERDTSTTPVSVAAEPATTAEPTAAPSRRGLWIGIGAVALAAVLVAGLWLGKGDDATVELTTRPPSAAETGYASIAVLPFVNMSPEKDQEYFTDGLSEELLNVLAQIRDLKVAGRTSSFQFRGQTEDFRVIGEKLGVASILEGSVRKAGEQVRITAQLVNVADGFQLWSETYDRTLEDIFAVQDDIARSVADALQVTLFGAPGDALQARGRNAEAFNLYLQGQHFRKLFGRENLERAVDYFEKALALDPGDAPVWAALSQAREFQAGQAYLPFDEGSRLAREAATRALELDEGLAEGWAALGQIRVSFDWDWAGAEMALGKARALAPSNVSVLISAANLSGALGRFDEAIALSRRAVELDPLNMLARLLLGRRLIQVGHQQEAEMALLKALELQPDFPLAHFHLGLTELSRSRPEAALAEVEREVEPMWRLVGLALAYHALGRPDEAEAALSEIKQTHGDDTAFQLAEVHGFRGETDAAFEWLERAYSHRDPGVVDLKSSPLLASLRDDPRWPVFLKKIGLPE
ncbi:MAG: protein kinase [Acidobacteriota bacterium]|nr:protein kinase [Acidobacteriota bacterium]